MQTLPTHELAGWGKLYLSVTGAGIYCQSSDKVLIKNASKVKADLGRFILIHEKIKQSTVRVMTLVDVSVKTQQGRPVNVREVCSYVHISHICIKWL